MATRAHASLATMALLTLANAGCSSPADEGAGLLVQPLSGLATERVSGLDSLGSVRAFAETEAVLAVAGSRGFALVEKGGAIPRATGSATLVSLTEAPASVAFAAFLAVTGDGRAVALDADAALTDVTARFGLTAGAVRTVANLGALGLGFTTTAGYAVAAGGTVRVIAQAGVSELFPCGGRLFARSDLALYRLDADARPAYVTTFPEGLVSAASDASGRVVASSAAVLYREVGSALAPMVEAAGFASIVATGNGNALLRGPELCLLNDAGIACTDGWKVLSQLFPSRSALPWAVEDGALVRVALASDAGVAADAGTRLDGGSVDDGGASVDGAATADAADAGPSSDEVSWTQTVKPIAERACFGCHGSVGAASVSLTSYAAWVTNRNAIRSRVVTQRNMPPNASSLAAADRTVIATWLGP
jgi:hypothetical protein